ncbi:hypothetical protein [Polymorphobacter megasporae]|uniref:hypothetical protein n=1 Tax=Glacieibacterium megasporae TaxID=2835787 RepID=UPI001C1E6C9C|nr:hypothetical protein [Polymorphobacter megasporae]UAJ12705.1 hypothetical protein KTC28_19355 [Polymorphobacter megasporae]
MSNLINPANDDWPMAASTTLQQTRVIKLISDSTEIADHYEMFRGELVGVALEEITAFAIVERLELFDLTYFSIDPTPLLPSAKYFIIT